MRRRAKPHGSPTGRHAELHVSRADVARSNGIGPSDETEWLNA